MPKKYPAYIKAKAIELRTKKKLTLDEIVDRLKLPKTTIYGWIKDIPIPRTNAQTEAQRRGTEASQAKYAKIREDAYQQGLAEAPELMKNPLFRDFVTLYIAEGSKTQRQYVEIGNSDKSVMKISIYWLRKFMGDGKTIEYRIQIHADHDEDEIKEYWAGVAGVQPEDIKVMRKSNSGKLAKRQFRSEFGVLSVRVAETVFRSRMQGWIDYLKKLWLYFDVELE